MDKQAATFKRIKDLAKPGQILSLASAIDLLCDIYNIAKDAQAPTEEMTMNEELLDYALKSVRYAAEDVSMAAGTLRDRFAMAALTGMIQTSAAPFLMADLHDIETEVARGAYKFADAMMKAREATHSANQEE